jgi:hypothetical protein
MAVTKQAHNGRKASPAASLSPPSLLVSGAAAPPAAGPFPPPAIPLSILSLNVAKQAALGGLALLIDQLSQKPAIILLQEVSLDNDFVHEAAQRLQYTAHISPSPPESSRRLVVFHRTPTAPVITDPVPGYAQLISFLTLSLLHIHAPSGSNEYAARDLFFRRDVGQVLAALPAPPLLLGDFNCVLFQLDAAANFNQKRCPPLSDLVALHSLTDAFHHLHRDSLPSYTFQRRGTTGSRLDRAYLSPPLLAGLISAAHIPSLSDHHALHITLAFPLSPIPPLPRPPPAYWKFNSNLTAEEDFHLAFTFMWTRLVASRPRGVCQATWWEETAKPAFKSFSISFGKLVAHRRRELASFKLLALQRAIQAANWPAVASLRQDLSLQAAYRLRGRSVRSNHDNLAPPSLQAAAATRRPSGPLKMSIGGQVTADPTAVKVEVKNYFATLFQGRHISTAERPEPHDSGRPFQPDFSDLYTFTRGLPTLSREQATIMEMPITLPELEQAVTKAANGRSPGLDGLSYEFYRAVFPYVGTSMVAALNTMLDRGQLTPSLLRGAVRLLPKVAGAPAASQLRPITLLACDYKLLSKVYVQRLLPLLPTVLTSNQLCSVQGRSIFDGCTSLLSTVEACHRGKRPGFLMNLDFFHAFDRVCMEYVDKVLSAMNFGGRFREVVATLHRGAKAAFLLDELTEDVNVDFSVRQGDPLAILLFIINMEPYLFTLAHRLAGLLVGLVREVVEGYVDDVTPVGENDSDILLIDSLTRKFEAMSGQILNRNRKTAILGLGTWAGRQDWPLGWLNSPSNLKIFGVTFGPSLSATMTASWEAVSKGVMAAINMWSGRLLPTPR